MGLDTEDGAEDTYLYPVQGSFYSTIPTGCSRM